MRDNVVVITGGGSGIGRCVALQLANLACKIAILDINESNAKLVAKESLEHGADYAQYGIRVNAILPGATETPLMWDNVPLNEIEEMRNTVNSEIPLGRLGLPEEPARAVVWLLSDNASYCTGSHLVCDGGILAKSSISV